MFLTIKMYEQVASKSCVKGIHLQTAKIAMETSGTFQNLHGKYCMHLNYFAFSTEGN